ncbi:MAG: F0F1 ATP synthase subunit B [Coriobacteriia bacterium]|nr:F0F1 ATP synthase subunit B [Coriobacteriia bacterium]
MKKFNKFGAALMSLSAFSAASLLVPSIALAEEGELGINIIIPKLSEFIPGVIAFLVIWFLLGKFAWPSIAGMLDKRSETIRESLASAEAARIEAQQLLDEYKKQLADARRESAEILAEAKRSGEVVRSDLTSRAQAEADEILNRARRSIEAEKQQASADLQSSIADISVNVAGKLIGQDLSDAEHRKLIEKYISEVGNFNEN